MTTRFRATWLATSLLGMAVAGPARAVSVQWGPSGPPAGISAADAQALLDQANQTLSTVLKDQTHLARGFANAGAYSAQAGTLQGYQNYDQFAVMLGPMVGIQAPAGIMSPSSLADEISKNQDVFAGVGVGAAINVGVNAGAYGIKLFDRDIYFNAKFFSYSQQISSVTADLRTFGIGANYALMRGDKLWGGLVGWRGLSLGLGFLVNSNDTKIDASNLLPSNISNNKNLQLGRETQFHISSNIVSIPLDVVTSVQLLYALNLTFGAGLDFNAGSSSVTVHAPTSVLDNSGNQVAQVIIDAGTSGVSPDPVRVRLMTGVGLNLGPVKIDVPLTWYAATGVNVGVSLGFIW